MSSQGQSQGSAGASSRGDLEFDPTRPSDIHRESYYSRSSDGSDAGLNAGENYRVSEGKVGMRAGFNIDDLPEEAQQQLGLL